MNYIFLFVTALIISLSSTPAIISLAVKKKIFDYINPRKIHKKNIPRIGGISIFISFIIANLIFNRNYSDYWIILLCSSIIFILGIIDDFKNLRPKTKLLWQIIVATIFILCSKNSITNIHNILPGVNLNLHILAIPFSIFFLTAIMNAINLADGLDGLASGISLIASIFLLYFAIKFGDITSALILTAIVGSLIGFLKYNSYPAKVFMGDSGSIFLGFILGAFSIKFLSEAKELPFYTIILILGIPIIDIIHVIYTRKMENKPIASGDQNHFHYRLMTIGFSHKQAVQVIFLLTIISGIIGSMPFVFPGHYSWFLWPAGILFIFFIIFIAHKIPKDFFFKSRYKVKSKQLKIAITRQKSVPLSQLLTNSLKYLLIAIFIIPAFFTKQIPTFLGITCLITAFILFISFILDIKKINDFVNFIFLCSCVVLLIANNYSKLYLTILETPYSVTWMYNTIFVLIALLAVTKFLSDVRARLFKTSILDFLLFMFPLGLTLFSKEIIGEFHLQSVSMKFLILFFATKILFVKKTIQNKRVFLSVILGLLIVGIIGGLKISLGGN